MGSSFTSAEMLQQQGTATKFAMTVHALSVFLICAIVWTVSGSLGNLIALSASIVLVVCIVVADRMRSAHIRMIDAERSQTWKSAVAQRMAYHYCRRLRTCMLVMLVPYVALGVAWVNDSRFPAAFAADRVGPYMLLFAAALLAGLYIFVLRRVNAMIREYECAL